MIYDDALVAFLGAVPRGKQYVDSSEFGRHGLLSAGASWQADSTIRRNFVGWGDTGGHYAAASFASISLDSFSVAAWFRMPTFAGLRPILFGGTVGETWANTNRWWLHINGGSLIFRAASEQITVSHGLAVDTWAHVGSSRASDGAVRVYLNGTLIQTGTLLGTKTMPGLSVGYQAQYGQTIGSFADAAVWGRVVSGDEFVKLANPRFFPLGTNRVGFPLSRLVN